MVQASSQDARMSWEWGEKHLDIFQKSCQVSMLSTFQYLFLQCCCSFDIQGYICISKVKEIRRISLIISQVLFLGFVEATLPA